MSSSTAKKPQTKLADHSRSLFQRFNPRQVLERPSDFIHRQTLFNDISDDTDGGFTAELGAS
jgi:hypothetical protein